MTTPQTSPANIIQQLLKDLQLCDDPEDSAPQWPGYISFLPDEEDTAICVYDTRGTDDGRLMTGEQIEHPGVQIRIRTQDYNTGWRKAFDIIEQLDGVNRLTVALSSEEAYLLSNVSRTGGIMPMGIDPEDVRRRHNFSINAILTVRPEEGGGFSPLVVQGRLFYVRS